MGSSSIWLSGREPVSSDTSSTEVRWDRKLIQMHPYPSQHFVCSSFSCFLWVKDSFREGVVIEACQWFETCSGPRHQTSTLRLCAIPQQGLVRGLVSQEARSCLDPFEHLCVNSILGKVCSFVGGANSAHCSKIHVWRVSSAHSFPLKSPQGLHKLMGWYKIFDMV